jgi:hypothetical protein
LLFVQVLLDKLEHCEAELAIAVSSKQYAQCASLQQELDQLRSMRRRFVHKMLRGARSPHDLRLQIADMENELKVSAQRGDFSKCGDLQQQLVVLKAQWKLLPGEEEIAAMVAEAQVSERL